MDANEVWQENKRWILGVVVGLLVFWVASSVIGGLYGTSAARRQISNAQRELSGTELYTGEALSNAREEAEGLRAKRAELEAALVFELPPEFSLEGKGDPDLHFDQLSRRVKRDILERASSLGVELQEKDLEWPSPVGEEIAPTLVGLCLLQQAVGRLLDAHEQARSADGESLGLQAIESFAVDAGTQAGRGSARRSRTARSSSGDLALREHKVRFRLRADEATVRLFLESCAAVKPPLALAPDFKLSVGRAPGDPLAAQGTLLAIALP